MNQVGSTFAKPLWQSPLPDSSWIVPLPFSSSLLCRLQSDLGPHLAASNSPLFPKFDPHLSMSNSRPLLAFATYAFVHELAETALCASYRQKRIETSFLGPILCFFALLETPTKPLLPIAAKFTATAKILPLLLLLALFVLLFGAL